MDIQRAFTFITDDEKWITKLLIAVVISFFSFLIVPIFIVSGYAIQIARNSRDGMDTPLPEWDDWSSYMKGWI